MAAEPFPSPLPGTPGDSLPPLFFILGPTAVGKTDLAAQVASECNCEIVSADAFQVYQGMDILTAKPDPATLRKAPHHLLSLLPPTECFDVAQFQRAAWEAISHIYAQGKFPLIAGGTGMYVRALTHGLADLPPSDPNLREQLQLLPLPRLQERYADLDPLGAKLIDLNNPRRLVRAIEVCLLTGKPFSLFRNQWERQPAHVAGFLLYRSREELYARINARTEAMFRAGLLDEVRQLGEVSATAGQAIGLKEARQCLAGEITEAEAIARIQQATRNYAKRQITWFKRETYLTPAEARGEDLAETISRAARSFFGRAGFPTRHG